MPNLGVFFYKDTPKFGILCIFKYKYKENIKFVFQNNIIILILFIVSLRQFNTRLSLHNLIAINLVSLRLDFFVRRRRQGSKVLCLSTI